MSMKDLISKMDAIQGVQTTGQPSTTSVSSNKILNESEIAEASPAVTRFLSSPAAKQAASSVANTGSGLLKTIGNAAASGVNALKSGASAVGNLASTGANAIKTGAGAVSNAASKAGTTVANTAKTVAANPTARNIAKVGLGAAAGVAAKTAYDAYKNKPPVKPTVTPVTPVKPPKPTNTTTTTTTEPPVSTGPGNTPAPAATDAASLRNAINAASGSTAAAPEAPANPGTGAGGIAFNQGSLGTRADTAPVIPGINASATTPQGSAAGYAPAQTPPAPKSSVSNGPFYGAFANLNPTSGQTASTKTPDNVAPEVKTGSGGTLTTSDGKPVTSRSADEIANTGPLGIQKPTAADRAQGEKNWNAVKDFFGGKKAEPAANPGTAAAGSAFNQGSLGTRAPEAPAQSASEVTMEDDEEMQEDYMNEEIEQLLDAIIEAQEIDRITGLSGISEAKLPSDYYRDYENAVRGGDNWKDAKNYKAIKDPLQGSKAYEKDSPYGYGRYGKNTADMQKYINQLGYKDKKGNALSVDARMGPKTGIAVDALRRKLDPNSAEYKTLRAFDDAAMLGDKDSRQVPPPKKVTPTKPTNTTDVPAPSNTPSTSEPSTDASSLRAKLDAASGKDTATPANPGTAAAGSAFNQGSLGTRAPETDSAPASKQGSAAGYAPAQPTPQIAETDDEMQEDYMDEEDQAVLESLVRIANLSGQPISEAKMKELKGKVHKGSYGSEYQGDEEEDSAEGKKKDKKAKTKDDSEKKKRGGQFKGDKDTSGKEKFGGADAAMKALGVGKAKQSKELDKLPAKKHSLKEYFDEILDEKRILAENQTLIQELDSAMNELKSSLYESAGNLDEAQCFEHICECYPMEVKQFLESGQMDTDLLEELKDHYRRHAKVPHAIMRGRSAISEAEHCMKLFEDDLGVGTVTQAEAPMEMEEGIEDAIQGILPKSMQPFNNDTAAAASKAQSVREANKPW